MTFQALPAPPPGGWPVILADPPWAYATYSKPGGTVPHRTEDAPYLTMSLEDIKALPVADDAAKDSILFLWTISSHMDQSFEVGRAWGFKYKAKAFEWFKMTKDGSRTKMGMGKWTRQESETCLLFTRGHPKRLDAGVRSSIFATPREHSRKPDEQYEKIERLVSGPYLELFAKYRWPGWEQWGDQLPVDPTEDSLEKAMLRLEQWLHWRHHHCLLNFSFHVDKGGPNGETIYRTCDKGHPSIGARWPFCDEFCVPF